MKIYISGKITGLSEAEATEYFNNAEKELKGLGFEVYNPMILGQEFPNQSWGFYMQICMQKLLDCDAIYMLQNWKSSKGAKEEIKEAIKLKFPVFYESRDRDKIALQAIKHCRETKIEFRCKENAVLHFRKHLFSHYIRDVHNRHNMEKYTNCLKYFKKESYGIGIKKKN